MRADIAQNGPEEAPNQPATMAAMLVGNDVYFSSSLRGRPFLVFPHGTGDGYVQNGVPGEAELAIFRCQQSYSENGHVYDMKCAEPLTIYQYLVTNPDASIVGRAVISTYGVQNMNKPRDDPTNLAIIDPCAVSKTSSELE